MFFKVFYTVLSDVTSVLSSQPPQWRRMTSDLCIILAASSVEKNASTTCEDRPLIRKADLENHNKDGGLWVVIHGRVYDVEAFKKDAPCGSECLDEYAGNNIYVTSCHYPK